MLARSRRPLLLGIRWCGQPPARIAEYTEAVLEVLAALEARGLTIPVHWNLAPLQLEKGGERLARLVAALRERSGSRGDTILPAGYSGALHPLLGVQELDGELAWTRENPWGSGIRTRFDLDPPAILPVYPDLLRERSQAVYSRQGFRALGVVLSSPALFRLAMRRPRRPPPVPLRSHLREPVVGRLSAGAPSPLQLFACLPLPPSDSAAEQKACLRGLLRGGAAQPLFLLLDYAAVARLQADRGASTDRIFAALQAGLEAAPVRRRAAFLTLAEALLPAQGSGPPPPSACLPEGLPEPPLPLDPVTRLHLRQARRARRPEEGPEEGIRRVLRALSADGEGWEQIPVRPPRAARRVPRRAVTASMTGSAVLAGPEFDAFFRHGQPAGLYRRASPAGALRRPAQTPPGVGRPADEEQAGAEGQTGAFFTIAGRRCPFQVESCVSFEGEGRMGLSAAFSADLPGARQPAILAVDYTFSDSGPELRLDFSLQMPALPDRPPVAEAAPLEIPLALLEEGEEVEAEGYYPDGSGYRCRLGAADPREADRRPPVPGFPAARGIVVLAGSRFDVRRGAERLRLEVPRDRRGEIHLLQLRLIRPQRKGGRCVLAANPFGSYFPAPASHFSGQWEEMSLYLGLEGAREEPDGSGGSPGEPPGTTESSPL